MDARPGLDAQAAVSAMAGYVQRASKVEPSTQFVTVPAAAQANTPWQRVALMVGLRTVRWTVHGLCGQERRLQLGNFGRRSTLTQPAPATARSADSPTVRRRHALREGGNAHPHRYDCLLPFHPTQHSQKPVVVLSSGGQQVRPSGSPAEVPRAGKAPGMGGALARSRAQHGRRTQASLTEFRPEDKPLREGAATNASRSPGNRSGSSPVPRSLSM